MEERVWDQTRVFARVDLREPTVGMVILLLLLLL